MRSIGSVAVIGAGSIGRRHLRNLRSLGADPLYVLDADARRTEQAASESGAQPLSSVDALPRLGAAFICTPTRCHVEDAMSALARGAHLYIEKPISDSMDGVEPLIAAAAAARRVVVVGFNLRFHPCLKHLRRTVEDGVIGRVLCAQIEFGQYLPDWHPWEDYRLGYSANRRMGGGILLDATHEFDYARWLLGEVDAVVGRAVTTGSIAVDTEDMGSFVLGHRSGAISEIHVDYLQRVYWRTCKVIGTIGTVFWDWHAKSVRVYRAEQKQWQEFAEPRGYDFNETYLDAIRNFVAAIHGDAVPMVDAEDAAKTLRLVLAAKTAAAEGRQVTL